MIKNCENLLIVDDHPDNLRMLATILSEQNYKVRKALSGAAALETIQVQTPDLILLDIAMPQMDGYEVCSRLKAAAATCEIPIIFLSGRDSAPDKVKAFAVGAADYIAKPFEAEEVLVRVRQQLMLQWQKRQLQQEISERRQAEAALRLANQELQRLANSDGLTQIANRRYFDEVLQQEWKRSRREQTPLAMILCDIDYFKAYNDHYGHIAGDHCLKQVAQAIHQWARRSADLAARYGGEEFAVILPNTSVEGAACVAAQIQAEIAELQISHAASSISSVITVSIGITCTIPGLEENPESLIIAADRALYAAKANGRNTCCVLDFTGAVSSAGALTKACQISDRYW